MRGLLERYGALRAPEGGAGGGGDGGGGGGAWSPPQGLPEAYRGASADETLGKLFAGFTEVNNRAEGLRTKLAGLPKAPEKPELYTFNPSDKLKPYFGDTANNPMLGHARNAFHKHGIGQEAFAGVIEDLYGPAIDAGLISAPFDGKAEVKSFMSAMSLDAAGATKALTEAKTFAEGLVGQLKDVPQTLQEDVKAALLGLTDTAAGNVLLRALAGRLSENGIRIGGEGNVAGALTEQDLKKLDADPRIDPQNRNNPDPAKRFDEALRKQYDEAYARLAPPNKAAW